MTEGRRSVKAKLPDGTVISIDAVDGGGAVQVSPVSEIMDLDAVQGALTGISAMVKSAISSVKPDSAKVEFGLDVKVESGKLTGFLVTGSGAASLRVSLEWKTAS